MQKKISHLSVTKAEYDTVMERDISMFYSAERLVCEGDIDTAWSALSWIFHSTDLDDLGFYQTATRLGVNPEQFKMDLLDRHQVARDFYYGKEEND